MGQQTVRRLAPLAVAVLVLALIGVVWSLLRLGGSPGESRGAGSGSVRPLELVGFLPASGRTPDPRYHLTPDAALPAAPGPVPVRRLVAGDAGPLREALARVMGDNAAAVTVDDSGHWSTPVTTVSSTPTGSVSSAPTGSPARPSASGAASSTLAVAGPVLEAAGLGDEHVTTLAGGDGTATVTVDPTVGGLPTAGLRTQLVVTGSTLSAGEGWMSRTPAGPAYPLVSAGEAYDLLTRTPLPMPLMACPEPLPPGTDPVPCGGPVTVTGARLGLALQQTADGSLLVPAWLFAVDGSPEPLVQVAVEPRLLRTPGASGGGTGGGSTGSVPGSTGTAAPPSAVPGEPMPSPASRFTTVSAGADGRTLDVTFWGGVETCYVYDVRTAEDAQQVRLRLVERRRAGDRPCIDLAREWNRTVRLGAPLGRRSVVDDETGTVLLGPAG